MIMTPNARQQVCSVLCCLLMMALVVAGTDAASVVTVQVPDVSAKAVYAYDATAGVELIAIDANKKRSPASTTKVASAIVVVDNIDDFDLQVTIEEVDLALVAPDESQLGLQPGDVLTVRQLLEGMLIQSGSDATYAAARVIGQSLLGTQDGDPVERFIEEMNAMVDRLDLKNTRFQNPVGIDETRHYSSAYDLAHMSEYALSHPVIEEIVAQQSIQMVIDGPNRREVTLQNTNALLDGETIHGVKTGSTPKAGACLVLAMWQNGTNRIIAVVLGSSLEYDDQGFIAEDGRWDDTETIIKAIDRDVSWISPTNAADIPGLDEELAAWQVALKTDTSIVVPTDDVQTLTYSLQLGPAGEPNTEVGRVLFFVGSEQIAQVPVYQMPIA